MNAMKNLPKNKGEAFRLEVPLDASGIKEAQAGEVIKVVVKDREGAFRAQTVKLGRDKKGTATFSFPANPGSLRVFVGPEDASDEELEGLQTLNVNVKRSLWPDSRRLQLPPFMIRPYYWYWWRRWCRTFTVRGVVRCPDGSPVPGAEVCAYDVDWWWWWSSKQQVGCDTTDATGAFEITFRWCCGWWPWWWWRHRFWRLEPALVNRILPVLHLDPTLPRITDPTPKPTLDLFERLLGDDAKPTRLAPVDVDPAKLPALREKLLKRLPHVRELEKLKIWPWWPWYPWRYCNPDLIFQVTQNCEGREEIIVDETVWDTRWDIPTTLDVTLDAGENACCVGQDDDPEGECLVIDSACHHLVAGIGGNPPAAPGVAADTDGFLHPAGGGTWSDRPYAGNIPIRGRFGEGVTPGYYEFEWSDDDGLTWNAMPTDAAGGFSRSYWGPQLGGGPIGWHAQPFPFSMKPDALATPHYVVESRQHFEVHNEPLSWGITRSWYSWTLDLLMRWKTEGIFADGRYRLHVKSWELVGGILVNPQILPLCATPDANGIVLYLDNRLVTAGPTNANGQPCGPDTVHLCTTEPDTDIVAVNIEHADSTWTPVEPCGNVVINNTDKVLIDFVAYDPDGHLAMFTLNAHYGEDELANLLSLGTLSSIPSPVVWAPSAAQVGPTYADAQTQGAMPPVWQGGAMRLTIDPATAAFERTCCYLLRLIARKRTIYDCDDDQWTHINRSERSFTIQV